MVPIKLLVVGATGIIGTEIVESARRSGFDVTIISRHSVTPEVGVTHIASDIYDHFATNEALGGAVFDVVIDLLAFDAKQLVRNLQLFGDRCEHYVFVSSATIYASSSSEVDEDSERTSGPWSYPLRKIEAEALLETECTRRNLSYTVIRPYVTYSGKRLSFGPWETDDALYRLLNGLAIPLGERMAHTSAPLTHASDLARLVVDLIATPAAKNEHFNIVSGEMVTWGQVFDQSAQILNTTALIVKVPDASVEAVFPELRGKLHDRLSNRCFNTSKLTSALPDAQFRKPFLEGYSDAIKQVVRGRELAPSPRIQGQMDRLLRDSGKIAKWQFLIYLRTPVFRSPVSWMKYLAGRYPSIGILASKVLRRAGLPKSDPYGLTSH